MAMRKHGFEKPYNAMQVGTWVLLPLLVLQFLLFVAPTLPLAASIPLSCVLCLCGFASGYFGYTCCVTDPIDNRLCQHLEQRRLKQKNGSHGGSISSHGSHGVEPDTKFCWVCETRVGVLSMHCKFCNKCVGHFDHHCQWLNTCVGQANYPYFFKAVVSTCLFVSVHTLVTWTVVLLYFLGDTYDDAMNYYLYSGLLSKTVLVVILMTFGFISLASSLLVGQLWYFHVNLRKEGITTYAYIVRDNAQRRDKDKMQTALHRRRIAAKSQAKRDNQQFLYLRLSVGAYVRPFDDKYCKCLPCITCDPLTTIDREQEEQQQLRKSQQRRKETGDEDAILMENGEARGSTNSPDNGGAIGSQKRSASGTPSKQAIRGDHNISKILYRTDEHEDKTTKEPLSLSSNYPTMISVSPNSSKSGALAAAVAGSNISNKSNRAVSSSCYNNDLPPSPMVSIIDPSSRMIRTESSKINNNGDETTTSNNNNNTLSPPLDLFRDEDDISLEHDTQSRKSETNSSSSVRCDKSVFGSVGIPQT